MAETCNSCGTEIVFEAGKQSLTCPSCGAVTQVSRPGDALETSFDRIVPISVTPHELDNRLYAYMASGNFTPDDMLEVSKITQRKRSYVPAFAFKIDYKATWTASFGFDREEPYTKIVNTSKGKEARTEYRTVTDWRPINGVDTGIFDVAGYAGTELDSSPLSPAKLAVHAVINGTPTEYNPKFNKGLEVERFSVPEAKVFESLDAEIDAEIGQRVKKHAQGDRQRDWHWVARMSHDTTTYAVPICHGAFQYRKKEYHVWVGGHDVDAIRADELPVDKDKQKTANIGFIPGALGFITAVGSDYIFRVDIWSSFIATALALGYGYMRRQALINYSKSIRNSLLVQIQASNKASNLSDEDQEKIAKAFQRPERPFFAQVHKDKIILPAIAAFAFFGAVVPAAITRLQIDRVAADNARMIVEREAVEKRAAQELQDRNAAEQQREVIAREARDQADLEREKAAKQKQQQYQAAQDAAWAADQERRKAETAQRDKALDAQQYYRAAEPQQYRAAEPQQYTAAEQHLERVKAAEQKQQQYQAAQDAAEAAAQERKKAEAAKPKWMKAGAKLLQSELLKN